MIKAKQQEWLLIWSLILMTVFMNLPFVYTYFYHEFTGAPEAIKGSINLPSTNPAKGSIYLDGQWEFYWNTLIISDTNKRPDPDMIIEVPGSWSSYKVNGNGLGAEGFGSYKLIISGLKYDNAVTVFIPDFGSAYRVFIDGELASESGTISKEQRNIFTLPKANLYPVILAKQLTHEVVIEVATTRFSGLYMTPVLQDYNQIISQNSSRQTVRLILFGVALFSLLSLIAMYTVSVKRKMQSIWLPIMILFLLMRIMLTTEFYSTWQAILFFNLSYESTNELMYFATFVLKYLLLFLVQEQCGIKLIKREIGGFFIYYVLLYLVYLLMPQSIYNQHFSVLVPMLTYVLECYLFIKVYRARQEIKKYGVVIFWGAILIIAGLTIDSYYINGKIYGNMSLILLILFTVFSLIMSWVYAMRIGDIYDEFTESTVQLELANSQISIQKEYYELLSEQMNEIREIKHDIRHLIATMSRLAEEDKMVELRMFLSEYGEKTKMEQLPIFCENVVANSIIGYYYLQAKEHGIVLESHCNIGREATMSDSDLCIVLGNALENAIDACKQMAYSKRRFVSVASRSMKGQLLIKVTNSYNGLLVVKEGRYISSKKEKSHGLGIRNIEKVMASYGGFVKIEHDEKEFTLMAAASESEK